jgi:site-specific DNA-methyltransferase (adenine-specific)
MSYKIIQGDNRDTLKTIPDNSIDAIVTDPPYGIDFLGKSWDANTGALETYQECLRVLKPGGHILAFSAARTYHHLAVTLEQAGFEIRDQIMWIYSSGFPKSQDVGRSIARSENKLKNTKTYMPSIDDNRNVANSTTGSPRCLKCDSSGWVGRNTCSREDCIKPWQADLQDNAWNGWGTALKPAHEPICLARKPIKLSIARNCQQWGVGALNIDATRVPFEDDKDIKSAQFGRPSTDNHSYINTEAQQIRDNLDVVQANDKGRFPSNVLGEIPGYQKYFYCPKVSRRERHVGYVDLDTSTTRDLLILVDGKYVAEDGTLIDAETTGSCPGKMVWLPTVGKIFAHGLKHEVEKILKAQGRNDEIPKSQGNNHPTVKPIELMKYLIQLVTPAGGTVLDPFTGSGSTGCAAVELGHPFIGCELDPNYVEIAQRRIGAWYGATRSNTQFEALFE